jgi:thiol-disulfide isomerase/thioredoxin
VLCAFTNLHSPFLTIQADPREMADAFPIAGLDFVKGQPETELKAGRVYFLESWATWCPPCKRSIPHLTELQRDFPVRLNR